MIRRSFLKWTAAGIAAPAVGGTYGLIEAARVTVRRQIVAVPRLPDTFAGMTVGVMSDLHLGEFNTADFIASAARLLARARPDLIALVGDFVDRGTDVIPKCFDALSCLRAPLGVFAVPGNHDMADGGRPLRAAMRQAGVTDLTNRGVWLHRGRRRLRVAGVDDLWWGRPHLGPALGDASLRDAAILLSHNPDFAETMDEPRVSLVLSGHTHGGQVYLPGIGSPWLPSRYGEKYLHGLCQGPDCPVYVSAGVGAVGLPFRFLSPPEVNVLTLIPTA